MVSKAKVLSIRILSDRTREYILELENNFQHEPGQFLQLTLEDVDYSSIWPDSRSFSIASFEMPNNKIRLVIKKEGQFTNKLFEKVQVNNFVTLKLPYGNFIPPFDFSKTLCIAGGTGIAPFLSFFDFFKANGMLHNLSLFHSTKFFGEAVLYNLLVSELGENYKLFLTFDKLSNVYNRRITIEDINNKFSKNTNIFICGNKQFNYFFQNSLKQLGYNNIVIENW